MALPFSRSEPGFWLSGVAHLGLIAAGLVAFTATKLPDATEGITVEVITDNQFSEITRGEQSAAAVQPVPRPRAERQAETHVQRAPGEAKDDVPSPPKRPAEVKLADQEVAPSAEPAKPVEVAKPEPPPPTPPVRPDRQEAAAKAEAAKAEAAAAKAAAAKAEAVRAEVAAKAAAAKAEADAAAKAEALKVAQREAQEEKAAAEKAAADKARAEARAKARAEAEAKAELDRKVKEAELKAKAEADAKARKEAERKRVAEAKAHAKAEAEAKARRQAEVADRFDPGDISRLLASRETSRSSGSTGREVQKTASLGTATGTAPRLNPSQRDQIAGLIREQLVRCWQPPIAVQSASRPPTAQVRLGLKQDGSLAGEPSLMNSSADPLFRPVADSALRATRRCAPLRIPAQFAPFYQDWKDLVVDFDPREIG